MYDAMCKALGMTKERFWQEKRKMIDFETDRHKKLY
jgi:hypothetical protein